MRETKFRFWDGQSMLTSGFHVSAPGTVWGWVDHSCKSSFEMKGILMQFTGLKDKNGVDIYVGDILRQPPKDQWEEINYSCYEVFFHDGDMNSDYNIGYSIGRCHHHGSVCGGYIPSFKPKQVSKMQIIGNIYFNPELIKTDAIKE